MIAPAQSILFLGYGSAETRLIAFLEAEGCGVDQTGDKVTSDQVGRYDLVLSFGYRHILKPDVIRSAQRPIINLHIAFLPWNRGAHPNFWAFHDGTPHGVTLHHMDKGVDTGDIVVQRSVTFSDLTLTFRQTQARLLAEIEELFMENWPRIRDMNYEAVPQTGTGTLHKVRDLPDFAGGWDCRICDALQEIKGTKMTEQRDQDYYLKVIDEIEGIRSKNNRNWMDLLRLAFKHAPKDAAEIMAEIYRHDSDISALVKKLTD